MNAAVSPTISATKTRYDGLWLLSRRADLVVVGLPFAVMALAFAITHATGQDVGGGANRLAVWTAQNLMGNATHVILTFLIFAVRPDTLKATPRLPVQVLSGIPAMALVIGLVSMLGAIGREAQIYVTSVIFNVFGLHHVLSQSKGFWALHQLRARQAGLSAPSNLERRLQSWLVPVNLTLVLSRTLLVAESPTATTPYIDIDQGVIVPFGGLGVLLLVWLVYWGLTFRALLAEDVVRGPKAVYLLAVASGVGLTLVAPQWGNVILPGMHGLEYYLLSARMLEQREGDVRRFPRAMIWPAMVLSMLPLFAIGLLSGLRGEVANGTLGTNVVTSSLSSSLVWRFSVGAALSCVLAHYWADALIYRFRIPEIRTTMLRRLGFLAPAAVTATPESR